MQTRLFPSETAANECKKERRSLIVTMECLRARAVCDLLLVADPRRERNERGCQPVAGCPEHELLCRRTQRVLPHDREIIRLQNAARHAADLRIVTESMIDLLSQLHQTDLRELDAVRPLLLCRIGMKVLRQRLYVPTQIIDTAPNGMDLRVCRTDKITERIQTILQTGQIRLDVNGIAHPLSPYFALLFIIITFILFMDIVIQKIV